MNNHSQPPGAPRTIKLDLTEAGFLPGDLLHRLDEIALESRSEFDAMIARLSKGLEREIDWWVTWPATRNTHASKLFTRCAQLALVAELTRDGFQLEVVTDDSALAGVLMRSDSNIAVRQHASGAWKAVLHNIASCLYNSAAAWLAARTTRNIGGAAAETIFAVEEGINESSFIDGRKIDHYYPDLAKSISVTDERARHIVPVFYRVRSYKRLLRLIRASDTRFLLREDYLTLSDYVFALGHWWRARRFLGRPEIFAGFAVGPLIDADLKEGRFTNAVFQALLSYRFWKKASRVAHVTKLLDWYEGHDRDHATAAAINWDNLPIRHVAYRHLTGPQYLGATPAQHEIDAGVVPRNFAIVGRRAAIDLTAETRDLAVWEVPSLRFAHLSPSARTLNTAQPEVLILLGLEKSFLRAASTLLLPAFTSPALQHVVWTLRPHPLSPPGAIAKIFGQLPPNVRLTENAFRIDLQRADIAIGSATNALLEALVAGVPVISLAAGNGPVENPIPPWIDQALARTCYETAELPPMILKMLTAPRNENLDTLRTGLVGDAASPGLRNALG